MAVVVDASAVGAIAFREPEGATLSAHIEGESLLAPVLLDAELASLALKKVARHPDRAAEMLLAFKAALALPITRVPVPALEAFALAVETRAVCFFRRPSCLSLSRRAASPRPQRARPTRRAHRPAHPPESSR